MAIRAPFLYAGYFCWDKNSVMTEYSYTDAQLQGLGGATEFVVTSGNFQNYFDATAPRIPTICRSMLTVL